MPLWGYRMASGANVCLVGPRLPLKIWEGSWRLLLADVETVRQRLHEAVAVEIPLEADSGEGVAVVTGWVLIAEWQGTDGDRWLSKVSSDATGDRGLPSWTERGLCSEVVSWPDDVDLDEDED